MITPTSFKIKVNGTPKTIDTVIDTDPQKDIIKNSTKDLFEPRTNNRFLVKILDNQNNEVIPSFLIKDFDSPELAFAIDTYFACVVYDSVTHHVITKLIPFLEKQVTVVLQITDPVGNVVETWTFKNATLKKIVPTSLSWSNDDVSLVRAEFISKYLDLSIDC